MITGMVGVQGLMIGLTTFRTSSIRSKLEVIRLDEEPISKIGGPKGFVGSSPSASAMTLSAVPEDVYNQLEDAYKHACDIGVQMAAEEGNTESDNPFDTGPLRESWLYGFRRIRNRMPKKPKRIDVDWKRDGF